MLDNVSEGLNHADALHRELLSARRHSESAVIPDVRGDRGIVSRRRSAMDGSRKPRHIGNRKATHRVLTTSVGYMTKI